MSKIVTIANHKGGVGKTTSVVNIGAGLQIMGHKVLLVDLDPQANLTQSLGVMLPKYTVYQALRGEYEPGPEYLTSILPGLDLLPSSLDLSGAEIELSGEAGREYILKELLEPLASGYDYILVDSPPSLGLLTINAFTSCEYLLIPIQPHYLAFQGLAKLSEVVNKIQRRLNKALYIGGIFVTQYDSRKVLVRDVVRTIEDNFGPELMETRIRENIALAEAPAMGLDIFRYNPKSNGAEDYLSLCREIVEIY
jgi:chromosome partitioning protein